MAHKSYATNYESPKNKKSALIRSICANVIIIATLFIAFYSLPLPSFFACTDPAAQSLIFTLCAVLALHFFSSAITSLKTGGVEVNPPKFFEILGTNELIRKYKVALLVFAGFVVLTVWLGSYTYSPFYTSQGDIPVLSGFIVTTSDGHGGSILSGQIVPMQRSSYASLKIVTEPSNVKCRWSSVNGGSFTNSSNCDTAYIPPLDTSNDLLQVQIRSACQFQETYGHLQINILP